MQRVYTLNQHLVPQLHTAPEGVFIFLNPQLLKRYFNRGAGIQIDLYFTPIPEPESLESCFRVDLQTPRGVHTRYFRSFELAEAQAKRWQGRYDGWRWRARAWVVRRILAVYPEGREW